MAGVAGASGSACLWSSSEHGYSESPSGDGQARQTGFRREARNQTHPQSALFTCGPPLHFAQMMSDLRDETSHQVYSLIS